MREAERHGARRIESGALRLVERNVERAEIVVELYPFLIDSQKRPHFELRRDDPKWYDFFLQQFEKVWADARQAHVTS